MSAASNTPGYKLKELGSMDKAKEKINEYYEFCKGTFFIRKKFCIFCKKKSSKLESSCQSTEFICSAQVCGRINFAGLCRPSLKIIKSKIRQNAAHFFNPKKLKK